MDHVIYRQHKRFIAYIRQKVIIVVGGVKNIKILLAQGIYNQLAVDLGRIHGFFDFAFQDIQAPLSPKLPASHEVFIGIQIDAHIA
jgi:hypothetical protein